MEAKSKLHDVPSCGDDFAGWFKSVTGREPKSAVVMWRCFMCNRFYKSMRMSKVGTA